MSQTTLLPSITELPLPPNCLFSCNFKTLLLNENKNFLSVPERITQQPNTTPAIVPMPNVMPCLPTVPVNQSKIVFDNEISHNVINSTTVSNTSNSMNAKNEKKAKGPWTIAEDKLLLDSMASFSGHICWEELSKMIPGRSAKQCRERWQFRLHPDVNKSPFEPWEDELIIFERNHNGSNWSYIASKLPGRTSCAVKNRWYTVLRSRRPDQSSRRAKVCPIQVTPFYMETIMLKNRKELWERSKDKTYHHS